MDVVGWPGDVTPSRECTVVTLGVFDGVHVGHSEILRRVVREARGHGCRAVVVTFDRHPAALLQKAPRPAITSLEHRLRLFDALGLDLCVIVRFSERVARMDAAEFAREVFHDLLRARLLVLGRDSRFGRGRKGTVALCRRLGAELGFDVQTVQPVLVAGRRVSSTAIRRAVLRGDFAAARRLLGRPYSLYGTVVRGDGRGKPLGYPTANLDVHNEAIPPDGVYAVWAFTDGKPIPAAASIGRRVTFGRAGDGERVVEVHLLDRSPDLYGQDLEVQFVKRLRAQESFSGGEQLAAQIARDLEACRKALRESSDKA